MRQAPRKPKRRWDNIIIRGVWVLTTIAIVTFALYRPATSAHLTLSVSEFSIRTDAQHLFSAANETSFILTGVKFVQMAGDVSLGDSKQKTKALSLWGTPFSTCSFTLVRSQPIELTPDSSLLLVWNQGQSRSDLALRSDKPMHGRLSSEPKESSLHSGFTCTRVHAEDDAVTKSVNGQFGPEVGTAITFETNSDSRIDLEPEDDVLSENQILVKGPLRFTRTDPKSSDEKTVLLAPRKGEENKIVFDQVSKAVVLNQNDLLTVVPERELWLRSLTIDQGIHLDLEGTVKDIREGAGPTDLRSLMPTLLTHLLNIKGLILLIPSVAGGVITILQQMKVLQGAQKNEH